MISLLYPLEWPCSVVSNLQPDLIDYLDAPFPYIVGVDKPFWNSIFQDQWPTMDNDIVVFDLKEGSILNKKPLPNRPEPEVTFMLEKYKSFYYDMRRIRYK